MKLITERNIALPAKAIIESSGSNGEKQLFIEGVFIECDIVNKNNRLYPSSLMKPVIDQYISEKVLTGQAWGELDHPESLVVNPKNISHRIVELKQDGSNWKGKAVLTDTPSGNLVKGLIRSGGTVAVSTRGGGEILTKDDGVDVISEFFLSTAADIVLDPSAPSAFVNGIMEGVEWIKVGSTFREIKAAKDKVNQILRENKYDRTIRADKFAQLLEKYLKNMSGK